MRDADTCNIRYIFLDTVKFTQGRAAEAQSDIITNLNRIVKQVLANNNLLSTTADKDGKCILIPTGDGVCIAITDITQPYDIHLKVATEILQQVYQHNEETEDPKRQFQIRIGLNENEDCFVTDINGNMNVAGSGINMSQRVMDTADGSQILIGRISYEKLTNHEQYQKAFRTFSTKDKHGHGFTVAQYIREGLLYLDVDFPKVFKPASTKIPRLTAYYLAHAIKNRDFFVTQSKRDQAEMAAPILLYFLACDSVEKLSTSEYSSPSFKTYGGTGIKEQYNYYEKIGYHVKDMLVNPIIHSLHLFNINDCFTGGPYCGWWSIVTAKGVDRLKKEWPDVAKEFGLTGSEIPKE
jgi:hypothetical protein